MVRPSHSSHKDNVNSSSIFDHINSHLTPHGGFGVLGFWGFGVFHGEDLIVYTTVVSVLVSKVVELLTEFCNELVFLTASNLDSRACHVSLCMLECGDTYGLSVLHS